MTITIRDMLIIGGFSLSLATMLTTFLYFIVSAMNEKQVVNSRKERIISYINTGVMIVSAICVMLFAIGFMTGFITRSALPA